MIDPVVRRAVPGDAGSLEQLEDEARAAVATTRGGERWLATHPATGAGWPVAIDQRGVFVATVDGDHAPVPVGFLVAAIRDDSERLDSERLVVIEQVYVHPDARELGFGDALVAAAVEYGRAAGATIVEAETLPGDRDIKNLYERAGITARLIVVSRRLR